MRPIRPTDLNSEAARDLHEQCDAIADAFDCALALDLDGPEEMIGVWACGGAGGDDLIGAGASVSDALADALATMRGWE